jgi:DNA-binding transcriptional MerR regulator
MQNGLQQLDLFGAPLMAAPEPRKKEKKIQPIVVAVAQAAPEPISVMEEAPVVKIKTPEPVNSRKATGAKTGKRGRKSFKEMDSEADLIEIPEDSILKQKLYYSISEVASWFKVNTSLLRYWENEFDILQPRKTRKGDRLFRVEDIKNLQVIYYLLRQRKFSIDGARNYLKNNKQEVDTQVKLMETLNRFKSFLLELKASLG